VTLRPAFPFCCCYLTCNRYNVIYWIISRKAISLFSCSYTCKRQRNRRTDGRACSIDCFTWMRRNLRVSYNFSPSVFCSVFPCVQLSYTLPNTPRFFFFRYKYFEHAIWFFPSSGSLPCMTELKLNMRDHKLSRRPQQWHLCLQCFARECTFRLAHFVLLQRHDVCSSVLHFFGIWTSQQANKTWGYVERQAVAMKVYRYE
jgi:hypothetical protein